MVQNLGRFIIPVPQIFGLYVLFFGQYGPGGGFIGSFCQVESFGSLDLFRFAGYQF